ncbi:unnamed protein product [Agarophyton chilense]
MSRSKWDVSEGTEDLTEDGSLLKIVLIEGDGDSVGRGAKVSLKYSLRLSDARDAAVFDSSARRKDGVLHFTLGKRKVIPALELVTQTMKLGEKCRVRAAAPYAFGSKGLKRKGVPPNATVFMDVELIHFEHAEKKKPFTQMSPAERFDMAKKYKEQGNALFKELKYDRAMAQYSQCIQYLANVFYNQHRHPQSDTDNGQVAQQNGHAHVANGSPATANGQQVPEPKEEGFQEAHVEPDEQTPQHGLADHDEVVETLDVSTATQEEKDTHSPIPQSQEDQPSEQAAHTDVNASEAHADSTVDHESQQKPFQQTQSEPVAENDSHVANAAHDQPSSSKEVNHSGGPSQVDNNGTGQNEESEAESPSKEDVSALHVTTLNNLSLCLLKLEQFKKAVESSNLALSADPSSFKAFYYRGRALVALGEWEKAREDLVSALKLQKNNMGIRTEIQKLDRKRKQFEEKEKRQAAAMFA